MTTRTYRAAFRRSHATLLALTLLAGTLLWGAAAQAQQAPYLSQPLTNPSFTEAIMSTCGGSLELSGKEGEKPRIEVYITSNNGKKLSQQEVEKRLSERYEIIIETSGNTLKAEARCKSGIKLDWRESLNISFKVYINSKVNSNLRTSGGSITMHQVAGRHNFTTSGGSLRLSHLYGDINGSTSGGSIQLTDSDGEINLRTSGGSITAERSKGSLQLTTSGGSIRLANLDGNVTVSTSGGSISAQDVKGALSSRTSGGSIRIEGLRGSVDAATSGGSVNVGIVEVGSYVKLSTSAGGINITMPGNKGLDLDLAGMRVNVPTLQNFSGSTANNKIKGSVSGGGIPVSARASGGSVNLSFSGGVLN